MKRFLPLVLLSALLALAYRPGLAGGFLFDDYGNLPALGAYGPVDDTTTLLRYLTSGTADPTGRPLALATFLLDARDWPADPGPFKRTNLLLHLGNGLLLAWLLALLGRERGLGARRAAWAAALGAGFWLLHPLFVSTTLYIVQREAMLPATFVLLGLIGYVHGRGLLVAGATRRGALLATAGIGLGTLLATLSKANGALLPLLALTLEATVLRAPDTALAKRRLNVLRGLVLGLPAAALLAYLLHRLPADWGVTPAGRPWTYGERLLTQARVLTDYLRLLWLPHPYTAGLFNDQYSVSTGLLRPWTTLPCVLFILALPVTAWLLRRRFPAAALALLFFFAGQLLESSIIPLELYFEHRNYLPALLLFWPLGCWLTGGGHWPAKAALAAVLLLTLAGMTHMRSDLWGNTREQARLWAELNPASPRANAYAAQLEMHQGHPARAERRLRAAIARLPGEPQLTINLLGARCQQGGVSDRDLALAARSLRETRHGTGLLFKWFGKAIVMAQHGSCPGLDFAALHRLLDAAWQNPGIADTAGHRQDLLHLQGRMALAQDKPQAALDAFDAALQADPRPAIALRQAALLGSAGFPCAGLKHLNRLADTRAQWAQPSGYDMAALHARLLVHQHYWQHEIRHIRGQLRADADERHAGCPAAETGQTRAGP